LKRRITWFIILVLIGAGGWYFVKKRGVGADVERLEAETVTAGTGALRVVVEATGKVVANSSVEVKSKASGDILRLPFEEGERVRAGELLAELDPDDERRNVERAETSLNNSRSRLNQARGQLALMESDSERTMTTSEANLRQAEVRFANAESQYNRRQGLYNDGVLNEEELEAARTAYEDARSALDSTRAAHEDAQNFPLNIELRREDIVLAESQVRDAEIALEEARERFEDTRIISPVDGVITDLQVEEGQIIASGVSNVGGGTVLMIISDLSRMFIEVKVDETDIGNVRRGQACEIIADPFPEKTLAGHVDWIAPQGVEESNITTFGVRVEIDLSEDDQSRVDELAGAGNGDESTDHSTVTIGDARLRPNMTARVKIITADLHDVVLVPNEAIQRGESGDRHVLVVTGDAPAAEVTPPEPRRRPASGEEVASGQRGPGDRNGNFAGARPGGGQRPSGARTGGARPTGGGGQRPGGGSFGGAQPSSPDQDLAMLVEKGLIAPSPQTEKRNIVLGPSDGIHTHVVSGLEADEELLVPIPAWRLEFLRRQVEGDDEDSNNRRRRGMF
jgi:HlyD family secretion protein